MKVVLAGGSGQVGKILGRAFAGRGDELVLKSRRVVPGRLLADGFEFRHPSWPEAARDLCARWRSQR